jgi:hypothetical protein
MHKWYGCRVWFFFFFFFFCCRRLLGVFRQFFFCLRSEDDFSMSSHIEFVCYSIRISWIRTNSFLDSFCFWPSWISSFCSLLGWRFSREHLLKYTLIFHIIPVYHSVSALHDLGSDMNLFFSSALTSARPTGRPTGRTTNATYRSSRPNGTWRSISSCMQSQRPADQLDSFSDSP